MKQISSSQRLQRALSWKLFIVTGARMNICRDTPDIPADIRAQLKTLEAELLATETAIRLSLKEFSK